MYNEMCWTEIFCYFPQSRKSTARAVLTAMMESGDLSSTLTLGTKHTDAFSYVCSYFQTIVICSRGIKGRMCFSAWSGFYYQEQFPLLKVAYFERRPWNSKLKDVFDEGNLVLSQQSSVTLLIHVNPSWWHNGRSSRFSWNNLLPCTGTFLRWVLKLAHTSWTAWLCQVSNELEHKQWWLEY